ncbi:DUF11 domain-containing protein [Paenibacillus agilis]|uniref:DUF11 domain-containing protein n=1 Tax=Paenibacillus agilis TaxID=3020863 RepID=A0A559J0M6_9BACL|nr:DUF11 domain-containing protein [Paenibacillus agilis]TVX93445.1 DUF11 domain-containing protein [Paenibacillus agilis]
MTLMLRFSGNASGDLTFAGNALGVSSIAELLLPPESRVLYAELVWAGSLTHIRSNLHISKEAPIHLTTPEGTKFRIQADPETASYIGENEYFRSANVTDIIQVGGAGAYIVNSTSTSMRHKDTSCKLIGWTLCVIYEHTTLPLRNLSLNVGGVRVNPSSSVTTTISGFGTPLSGPVAGKLAMCIGERDEHHSDLLEIATANPIDLTNPNDVFAHFFNSLQVENSNALTTHSTLAMPYNYKNETGTKIVSSRRWDISNIDISQSLSNSQTSAMFQFRTTGDFYNLYAAGISIDINQPQLEVTMRVNRSDKLEEQALTYSIVVQNTGMTSVESVIITDSLADHTLLIPESVCINRKLAPPDMNPTDGIFVGTLVPEQSITVIYKVKMPAHSQHSDTISISNKAFAKFQYRSVADGPIVEGNISSNEVFFVIQAPQKAQAVVKGSPIPLKVKQKIANKSAYLGDTLYFTFKVTNASDSPLEHVIFTNNFEDGTKFIPRSVNINGKSNPKSKPAAGISLLNLESGQSVEISYCVKQISLPKNHKLRNHATVSYRPVGSTDTLSIRSNIVVIKLEEHEK